MTEVAYRPPTLPWFLLAVLTTPVAIGVFGAPFMVIPTFAAVLGAPAYLMLGVPLVWLYMHIAKPRVSETMLLGFIANLGTFPLYFVALRLLGEDSRSAQDMAMFCAIFGVLFAPIFAIVLVRLARAFTPAAVQP